jgi:hypothetical protein
MQGFTRDRWSGNQHLFWTGGQPGERLELEIPVSSAGTFDILAAFTMARDYAIVKVELDGQPLRKDLDLYNSPDVISTGEISFGERKLEAGAHRLVVSIVGCNPAAVRAYMVGLDYIRLKPGAAK